MPLRNTPVTQLFLGLTCVFASLWAGFWVPETEEFTDEFGFEEDRVREDKDTDDKSWMDSIRNQWRGWLLGVIVLILGRVFLQMYKNHV